jgi:hypothetical protein
VSPDALDALILRAHALCRTPNPIKDASITLRTQQYIQHIRAFADVLYSWELYAKRAELLKALHRVLGEASPDHRIHEHDIGMVKYRSLTITRLIIPCL